MKITVITPILAIAGVPLAQVRFARALAARGHFVELLVGRVHPDYQYEQPAGIKTIVMNKPKVRSMLWPLIKYLRAEKPDIVFTAEDHLNIIVLIAAILARSKSKISGSSRVTPFDTYSNVPFTKRWFLKQLARLLMSRADALTCVSSDMVTQYRLVFSSSPHICVYNIVDDFQSRVLMHEEINHPWLTEKSVPVLVAAGRLAPWKGFDYLIKALVLLSEKRKVRLLILGDGPMRAELQGMIDTFGLNNIVELVGYVYNPLKYFSRADVFILSSLVEGLPNVLVEAMMCGCTPVATNCPTGPSEVLQDGKYGYLVPMRDVVAMSMAIEQALDNRISKKLLNEAVVPFEEGAVIDKHFELLGLRG